MRSVKFLIAAGAASLLSSMAFAADMPSIMPPPAYAPPPPADFGGWYLRGDIGMTNQSLKTGIGVFFFAVALIFVYRSFYCMRIPEDAKKA